MADLSPDIVVIGSGVGGATIAHALAPTGARILVLERGTRLVDSAEARDDRAIFQRGHYRTSESWYTTDGTAFNPGNFYNVGGNSKFYGAVMFRYRAEDFRPVQHMEGATPGWPITYDEIEPWYGQAERLFAVRGQVGEDKTEPFHSTPYAQAPVPDESAIAQVRARLHAQGLHPASLPLAVDHEAWLARASTPWDGFPSTTAGKIDAENGPLDSALKHANVQLMTGAEVLTLEPASTGKAIAAARVSIGGEEQRITGKIFVLAAGAVNSAALLLRSDSNHGLANGSDQVGRNFMNHNCTAMVVADPRLRNTAVYQKTLYLNDFYLADSRSGFPLGNVQLLGKISGAIFKANLPLVPEMMTRLLARHSVDWYLMSEDLPQSDSRVRTDGRRIILDWRRSNLRGHAALVARMREVFRAAGFPIVMARAFDKRTPSHQCGTARMGKDPATSVVDPWCRAHDIGNLLITDASVLPTSAAVNPALTVAALALRAGDRLRSDLNAT